MRLKKKLEQTNVSEEKNTAAILESEKTELPIPEKKTETTDSDLRKKAEEVLEKILLGSLKPSRGMKISLNFKGPFKLLGIETTAESTFEYNYPDGSNEETPKQEEPISEKQEKSKEVKLEEPQSKRLF